MIFYLFNEELQLMFLLIYLSVMILSLIQKGNSQIAFQRVQHPMTKYQL